MYQCFIRFMFKMISWFKYIGSIKGIIEKDFRLTIIKLYTAFSVWAQRPQKAEMTSRVDLVCLILWFGLMNAFVNVVSSKRTRVRNVTDGRNKEQQDESIIVDKRVIGVKWTNKFDSFKKFCHEKVKLWRTSEYFHLWRILSRWNISCVKNENSSDDV